MSILIIGLMFGTVTSAIISVFTFFSDADKIQQFVFWGFGSLGNLSWNEILVFFTIYLIAILTLLNRYHKAIKFIFCLVKTMPKA